MRRRFTFHQRLSGNAPLVISGRRQAWITNDVTYSIDMRQGGLVHAVDLEQPAAVSGQADVFQRQRIGITGTTVSVEQAVGFQLFAGLQVHNYAIIAAFDLLILFVMTNHHAAVPEVVRERVGHLLIEKRQQAVAGVYQVNFDVHAAEDGSIFTADHPGTVNQYVARLMVQAQNGVAVVDARMGEIHICRTVRA